MILLAFDTSGGFLSAAVYDKAKLKARFHSDAAARHSEALVPLIKKILQKAKVRPKDVGCVAVGTGPGSFTGLRIGVTAAKVLAYALDAKLVGISSLEAMARAEQADGTYAILSDARRGQVYAALYRRKEGRWTTLSEPRLYAREDYLRSMKPGIRLVESARARAESVAEAAFERAELGRFDDPFELEPLYISPKDCNVAKK